MTDQTSPLTKGSQEQFLDLLINRSKDGIIVIDKEGVIRFANPAAEEIFAGQADDEDLVGYQIGMPAIEDDVELQLPRDGQTHHIEMRVSELSWKEESAELALLRDITDRKEAQLALERHKNLLQETGQMAQVGGWEIDFRSKTVWWSQVTRDIHGVPEDYQPTLQEAIEFFPPDVRPRLQEAIRRAREDLEPFDMELPFITADGNRLWVRAIGRAEELPNGRVRVHGTFQDITQRKAVQERLRESEQKFRTLYETMAQGVVYQNAEGEITSANPAAERILGLTLDQMQGRTSMDPDWQSVTLDGDPLPGEQHPAMVALRTGEKVEDYVFGVYHPEKDRHVWISVSAVPQFREGDPEPYQVFTTFLDITDRVKAERQLKERVKELSCIAAVGEMIQKNPSLERLMQNTVDILMPAMQYPAITAPVVEIKGERLESKRYHEGLTRKLQAPIKTGTTNHGHVTVYYLEEKPFILPEEQRMLDQIGEMLALWYEQKITRERLRSSRERLELAVQGAELGIWDWDIKSDTMEVNALYAGLLGYQPDEMPLEVPYWKEHVHPDDQEIVKAEIKQHLNGKTNIYQTEHRLRTKSGDWIHALDTGKVVERDAEGNPVRFVGVLKDISNLVETEQALRRSEERFRALIENARDMVAVVDQDGTIQYASPSVESILGFAPEEHIGEKAFDFIHPQDLPRVVEYFQERSDQPGSMGRLEYRMKHKEGGWRFVESIARNALDQPAIKGIIVNSRDVTQRHNNERMIERQMEQLSIQHEVASMGVEITDQDTVIARTTDLIAETFRPENCGVLLLEEDQGILRYHPSYRLDEEQRPLAVRIGQGVVGMVAETREPRNIPDVRECDAHQENCPVVRSELCVPIQSEGHLCGVFNIEAAEVNAFSPEDEQLLVTVAHQLATVLSRIDSVHAAERRITRLQALREIDQAISGSLDLEITLNVLLDRLVQNLEVDACDVLLYNPELQSLEYKAGKGFETQEITGAFLRLGEGYAGKAILERKLITVSDLEQKTVRSDFVRLVRKEGFKEYIGVPLIAKGQVIGALEIFKRSKLDASSEWLDFLDTLAGQAAIAIDRLDLFNQLQRSNMDLERAYNDVIEGWSRALELRDQKTEGHSRRVERLTLEIAQRLGVQGEKLRYIREGALLHDIGKMGVPDQILQKPGKLTEEEWEIMRKHPTFAYNMLSPIDHLRPALDIPYCHHEKWDGSGYPQGLKGEEIPLPARIFAVVDVWDALRSDRPYRDAWSDEKALSYIKEKAGTHFDPEVVEVFLDLLSGEGLPEAQNI